MTPWGALERDARPSRAMRYGKLPRILISIAALASIVVASFWAGAFSTWFELNLCYSEVISTVAAEAEKAASSNSAQLHVSFKAMLNSLPLHGYETECKEVLRAISLYKAGHAGP